MVTLDPEDYLPVASLEEAEELAEAITRRMELEIGNWVSRSMLRETQLSQFFY